MLSEIAHRGINLIRQRSSELSIIHDKGFGSKPPDLHHCRWIPKLRFLAEEEKSGSNRLPVFQQPQVFHGANRSPIGRNQSALLLVAQRSKSAYLPLIDILERGPHFYDFIPGGADLIQDQPR